MLMINRSIRSSLLVSALALACSLVMLLASCAGIPGLVERPRVAVDRTEVTGLNLRTAEIRVRFEVENPNSFGLDLSGLDYALDVAGRTLFEGDRRERLTFGPGERGFVDLPISVRYEDVYQVARDIYRGGGRDQVGYTVRAGLRFQAPLVGELRVPAEARGEIPLLGGSR
jgi:LEA14-like dessication related protein